MAQEQPNYNEEVLQTLYDTISILIAGENYIDSKSKNAY